VINTYSPYNCRVFLIESRFDGERDDRTTGVLEDDDGFLVRESFERHAVDGDDLVAAANGAGGGGGAALEHGLNVNGQVTVGRAVATDYAEAEAVRTARQSHLATREWRLRAGDGCCD
jgi:hypothetical protein